jgi:small conductance mechanosensitive channel
MPLMDILNQIITWLADSFWQIMAVVIALIVGRWASNAAKVRLRRRLLKREVPKSFINLSDAIIPYIIWFLVVLVVFILLGVPVNSLLIAAAIIVGVIAITMRESIGNFAATVNFWLFKPFENGHVIETGNTLGTVHEIELFTTVIYARDNKVHVLPNSTIQENGLINYSTREALRVDLVFSIGYHHDLNRAKELLAEVLAEDDRVLENPAPRISLKNLGESSVDINVRPFVTPEDYWSVEGDIKERAKNLLEANGIVSPFRQIDININQNSTLKIDSQKER